MSVGISAIADGDGNFVCVESRVEKNPIVGIIAFAARTTVAILIDGELSAIADFIDAVVISGIGIVFSDGQEFAEGASNAVSTFCIKIPSDDDIVISFGLFLFNLRFKRTDLFGVVLAM